MGEIIKLCIIGLGGGILSGMFGVGGGVIMVPGMVFLLGMSQHLAQGTSLGAMLLPIGILAAYNYHKAGSLDIKYALVIAFAFIVGGYFGSKLSLTIDEVMLKKLFGGLMLLVALKLIFFTK